MCGKDDTGRGAFRRRIATIVGTSRSQLGVGLPFQRLTKIWLGRQDSNLRMPVPKTGALPLGDAPVAAVSGFYALGRAWQVHARAQAGCGQPGLLRAHPSTAAYASAVTASHTVPVPGSAAAAAIGSAISAM